MNAAFEALYIQVKEFTGKDIPCPFFFVEGARVVADQIIHNIRFAAEAIAEHLERER